MASLRQDARSAAPLISEEEHDVDFGGSDQEWDDPSPEAEEAGRETSDVSVATGKRKRASPMTRRDDESQGETAGNARQKDPLTAEQLSRAPTNSESEGSPETGSEATTIVAQVRRIPRKPAQESDEEDAIGTSQIARPSEINVPVSHETAVSARSGTCGATATVGRGCGLAFISDVAAWLDDHAEDPGKNPTQRPWTAMDDTKLQQLMLAWLSCAGLQTTVESAIDATYRYRLHKWLQHSYEDNYQMIVDYRKDVTQALQPVTAMWDPAEAPIRQQWTLRLAQVLLDPRVQRSPAVQALPKQSTSSVIRDMPVADQAFWDALDVPTPYVGEARTIVDTPRALFNFLSQVSKAIAKVYQVV
eukprot:gene13408-9601_t